ncbi:MAG: hypothetical protein ACREMO_01780, partial [Gemmatimonadales bacterium]
MTWAHTCSGSNRILIVGVAIRQNTGGEFVDSITYNGVNLTFVDGISYVTNTSIRGEMWQLVAPATGPHNIIVTINPNGGSGAQAIAGGAQSFTGVHQTTPLGTPATAQNENTTSTVVVSSAAGEVVVDIVAQKQNSSGGTMSADAPQVERWNQITTKGTISANARSGGSTKVPGAASVTMSWTVTSIVRWAIVGVSLKPANATAVKLASFTAAQHGGGRVLLEWRSGYEVNNLGYHLYREQGGERVRLTPELVAGSALFAGAGTALTAGRGYTWWDAQPAGSGPVQYWLEDVDLNGTRTWHGPVTPVWGEGVSPERSQAVLLSRLGSGNLAPGSSGSSGPGIVASPVPPGSPGPGSGNGGSRLEEQ